MSSSSSAAADPPRKRPRDKNTPPTSAPNAQRRRGGPHVPPASRAPMPPLGARAKGAIRAWADGFRRANDGRFPTARETADAFPQFLSASTAGRIIHGGQVACKKRGGSAYQLDEVGLATLYKIVIENPLRNRSFYRGALVQRLGSAYAFGETTISTAIKKRLKLSLQARRALAAQRNGATSELYALAFLRRMTRYGDKIAWFDASGVNNRTGMRTRGWAPVGAGGCHARSDGNRCSVGNSTVIQFMDWRGQCCAPGVFVGGTTMGRIVQYYSEHVHTLFLRGIKCVVLDNAAVHPRALLAAILGFWGIDLVYLPPYYPNWNPIEQLWLDMKRQLAEHLTSLERDPKGQIEAALKTVDRFPGRALSYVRHTRAYPLLTAIIAA